MKKDNPIIQNRINYSDQNKNIPIQNKNIPNPNKYAKQLKKQSHPFRHQ